MSTAENTIKTKSTVARPSGSFFDKVLSFLSSVRFGVVLLCILVVLSMIGMLIVQQNVQGFDSYYVGLTPAERALFGSLGFFDIYHSWYFNLILLVLSLNIILASIDRFPSSWKYIAEPKVTATLDWLRGQKVTQEFVIDTKDEAEATAIVSQVLEANGYRSKVTNNELLEYGTKEDGTKNFADIRKRLTTNVFGQWGRINRLGAYIVHVFLLTLFLGHFVALQTGFDADVRMVPGVITDEIQLIQYDLDKKEKFNVKLPFSMECTDIQQRLINEQGTIDVSNTLDWRTQMRIDDPDYGSRVVDVSMNSPVNYRGYRFFQAQTIPMGHARTIKLELTPDAGGEALVLDMDRNGSTTLPDGTLVEYAEFMPDFTFGPDGKPDTRSGDYNNPVAVLNVTPPNSERQRVFAFAQKLADNIPVGAPKAGYKWRLAEFEKSPFAHVLSIKYDPYQGAFVAWYIGGFGLMGALMFVFLFSHQRFWADVRRGEDGKVHIVLAGDANRNLIGFKDKFSKVAEEIETAVKR